jgi:PAS domain S-box-containing protein
MNWIENARHQFLRQWIRLRWRSLRNHALDRFSVPAPAGLAVLDSEFRVIQANETLADMTGVSRKAIVGKRFDSFIPQFAASVQPVLRSVSRTEIPALNCPVSGASLREPGVIRHWIASVFPICEWGFAGCVGVIVVDVTDQVQFGLLTAAEHLANVGSWEVNVLTGEEIWSPNLRRMLGLGTNHTRQSEDAFWALVHPEDRDMVRSIIDWAMKFNHPYEYKTRVLLPDCRERSFHTRGKIVLNSSGCVLKRVGVTQDITEEIEASRALIEGEKKLKLFRDQIDHSNDAFEVVDPETLRFLDMNQKGCSDLGYSLDEIRSLTVFDIDPTVDESVFAWVMAELQKTGSAMKTGIHRRKDGSTFPVEVNLRQVRLDGHYIIAVVRDITERKQAEEKLQQAHMRVESILASVADVHIQFDRDWHYLYVNEAAVRAMGHPREKILGRTLWEMYPDIVGTELERQYRHAMDDRIPIAFEFHYETLDTWWGNRFYPAPEGLTVFASEITERKRSEEALRKQKLLVQGLFQTAKTLTRGLELQSTLDVLNFQALTLIGAESAWAGVRTKEGFCCDSFLEADPFNKSNFTWPPGIKISGKVLQSKQVYLTNDAEHDDRIPPEIWEALGLRSVLCVPVFDIHGEVIAFFALNNKKGGFGTDDVAMAQGISAVASIAIQNSLTYRRVRDAEDELRRLSTRLMTSQDYEHRQIAEELHEHTAQDLAGLIMNLSHLRSSLPDLPPPSRTILDESVATARRVFHETRTLSYRLHDSSLELAGLAVAIPSYARTFGERSGITVRTEIPQDFGRLTPDEETTVYRIVQQALSNVYRHSGSEEAAINVHREGERVLVEIEDSGGGMRREDDQNANAGVGIASMRERVKRHGGSIDIESAPGKGFKIRFQFPTGSAATKHAAGGAGHD